MRVQVKDHSIPLNGIFPVMVPGKYFMLVESTEPVNVNILVANSKIGRLSNIDAPFTVGPFPEGFEGVELETVSGAAQSVKVGISDAPIDHQRLAGSVTTSKGDTISEGTVSTTAATAKQVLAAGAGRRAVTLTNTHASALCDIGSSGIAVGEGVRLGPGDSVTFSESPNAAFYAIRTAATDVSIAYLVESN